MKNLIGFLFLFILIPVCNAQDQNIDAASWLSGCWISSSDASGGTSVVEEVWMKPSGGLMVGMSRTVRGGVATGYEFLLIREDDGALVYSAYPSGQQPTEFRSTEISTDLLRVINPDHDFPQKIEYWRVSGDEIRANVYGDVDADDPAFELQYQRSPC